MQPYNEEAVMNFLLETRKIPDPKERLRRLEGSEFSEETSVKAARAWWEARYHFTNKKKTITGDRFIWFLLTLKNWSSNPTAISKKCVVDAYREIFLSSEIEHAIALEDRLEEEMLSACVLYIGTIDTNPRIFGFSAGKALEPSDAIKRISAIVAGQLLPGAYKACAQFEHIDVLIRCLWKGAEEVYPGISANLDETVGKYADEQMRDFVLRALSRV